MLSNEKKNVRRRVPQVARSARGAKAPESLEELETPESLGELETPESLESRGIMVLRPAPGGGEKEGE